MAAKYAEGFYLCQITGQALVEGTGNKSDAVHLTIQPKGYVDNKGKVHEEDYPFERTIYLYLSEGTIGDANKPGWVMETLWGLGFAGTSFGALDPDSEGACDFRGLEVRCLCQHEEYNGTTKEKWSLYQPKAKKEYVAPQPKTVRSLDAKFGKVLKLVPKKEKSLPGEGRIVNPAVDATMKAGQEANDEIRAGEALTTPAYDQGANIPF